MESGRNLFNNNNNHSISNCGRLQANNHNNNNDACPVWNPGAGTTPRIDWSCTNPPQSNSFNRATTMAAATDIAIPVPKGGDGAVHALMANNVHQYSSPASCTSPFTTSCLYSSGVGVGVGGGMVGSQYCCYPDPHLMCLMLGKRHYFGDAATPLGDRQGAAVFSNTNANALSSSSKRGKPYYEIVGASTSGSGVTVAAAAPVVVPRCQVDGCHLPLVNAKDYHRRHKVCEMHSKAPKVVVLGLEQRFCQQCSRFHAVGEFDESKRSCRRRLAGHNERRRKSSQDQSTPRSHSHHQVHSKLMTYGGRHPYFPLNNGCALSLLSSKNDSWISSSDLPARCSAALRELIAENRAAILSRQLILDKDLPWHHHQTEDYMNGRQNGSNSLVNYQQQMGTSSHTWGRTTSEAGGHLTLDLMQAPNSAFGFLSVRGKSKEDEDCPDLWGTFGGANVV